MKKNQESGIGKVVKELDETLKTTRDWGEEEEEEERIGYMFCGSPSPVAELKPAILSDKVVAEPWNENC